MKLVFALAFATLATVAAADAAPQRQVSGTPPTFTDTQLIEYVGLLDLLCRGGGLGEAGDATCAGRDYVYDEIVRRGYCVTLEDVWIKGKSEDGGVCVSQ
jgi:hypothetical protein